MFCWRFWLSFWLSLVVSSGDQLRICSGVGCLRSVPDSVRFCDDCKPITDDSIKVHSLSDGERFSFLYKGARWQKVRREALRNFPTCAVCSVALSVIVDHIVPSGVAIGQAQANGHWPFDQYAGFYFVTNLQGLCRDCHYTKTLADKTHTGPWPDVCERQLNQRVKLWSFN
jgi:5-methylcytosine-specific restriction endonuclease McrA